MAGTLSGIQYFKVSFVFDVTGEIQKRNTKTSPRKPKKAQ